MDEEDQEIEVAAPEYVVLGDGAALIFDIDEFRAKYNCDAVILLGKQLFGVDATNGGLVDLTKPREKNKIASLRGLNNGN